MIHSSNLKKLSKKYKIATTNNLSTQQFKFEQFSLKKQKSENI